MGGRTFARCKVCAVPLIFVLLIIVLYLYLVTRYRTYRSWAFLDDSINFPPGLAQTFRNMTNLPVWPEDDPSDRILAQLHLTAPSDAPVKTIVDFSGAFKVPKGNTVFVDSECLVQKCSFVSDMKGADAVLFRDVVDIKREKVPPEQVWILYSLESPYHSGVVTHEGSINWTATYRRDSDIVTPYAKWVYYDQEVVYSNKPLKKNYAEGKTKKVATFISNCHAQNNRLNFVKELAQYIDVDIYGRCGSKHCSKQDIQCFDMLRTDYKFYLAFENSNCRDYITEKFFENALLNDVLPVVMGAYPDDYYAGPEHSFIHVDYFPSVEDLASFLHLVDGDDAVYNSYFAWKGTGSFIDTKFFCRLCALLHKPRSPKNYPSFRDWWNGDGICKSGRWIN